MVAEYLNKIRLYLRDITNILKNLTRGKLTITILIILTIAINFISSKDNDEERVMHLKSDIIINGRADEVTKKLLQSLKNRYHNNLKLMKGGEFVFDYVHLLYYKCHKINPNRGGSYKAHQ